MSALVTSYEVSRCAQSRQSTFATRAAAGPVIASFVVQRGLQVTTLVFGKLEQESTAYFGKEHKSRDKNALHEPYAVASDSSRNLYCCNTFEHSVSKITPEGVLLTLAGNGEMKFAEGTGDKASFITPQGICVAPNGTVYVADTGRISCALAFAVVLISSLFACLRAQATTAFAPWCPPTAGSRRWAGGWACLPACYAL